VWRDVKIRYKQTAVGVLWVVLQPLLTMAVFTLFFGRLAKLLPRVCRIPSFILLRSSLDVFNYALQNATTWSWKSAHDHESLFSRLYCRFLPCSPAS